MSVHLPPSGKRAAIIGAGPAGLTAAWYLAKKGHAVTVFDALPAAGGMIRYGIPGYRVPVDVLDREVGEVAKLGVEFEFDRTRREPRRAVRTGLRGSIHRHRLPGRRPPGRPRRRPARRDRQPDLPARGEHGPGESPRDVGSKVTVIDDSKVAVIGGGNVAADSARTTRRFGAAVDMVYRRTAGGNADPRF